MTIPDPYGMLKVVQPIARGNNAKNNNDNNSNNGGNRRTVITKHNTMYLQGENQIKKTNNQASMTIKNCPMPPPGIEPISSIKPSFSGNTSMIEGQKWHIISFNNAPVLNALLGGLDDENSKDRKEYDAEQEFIDTIDHSLRENVSNQAKMSFQEALKSNTTNACLESNYKISQMPTEKEPFSNLKSTLKKKKTVPPSDYVCKLCSKCGHWMEDCSFYRPHTIVLNPEDRPSQAPPPPPPNYLCRLCAIPGHWIDQCSKFTPKAVQMKKEERSEQQQLCNGYNNKKQIPKNYVCNLCKQPGHWIQCCAKYVVVSSAAAAATTTTSPKQQHASR